MKWWIPDSYWHHFWYILRKCITCPTVSLISLISTEVQNEVLRLLYHMSLGTFNAVFMVKLQSLVMTLSFCYLHRSVSKILDTLHRKRCLEMSLSYKVMSAKSRQCMFFYYFSWNQMWVSSSVVMRQILENRGME